MITKMLFRTSVILASVVFQLAVITCLSSEESPQPPHIILIYADDLGWNDVSFNGSPEIPTPNIDALALNGMVLHNYYGEWLCTPSRGALLSGILPMRLGLQHSVIKAGEATALPLDVTTLPQHLKKLNYKTHMVGKWHLGCQTKEYTPIYRGFDTFFGFYNGFIDYYDYTTSVKSDIANKPLYTGLDIQNGTTVVEGMQGRFATRAFTETAENIILNHNPSKPLFLYLAELAVHSNNRIRPPTVQAPADVISKFKYIKDINRRTFAGGDPVDLGFIDGMDMWQTLLDDSPSPRMQLLQNLDPVYGTSAFRLLDLKVVNGTTPDGLNYWYGPTGFENFNHPANYEWVFKEGSLVKDILQEMGMWIVKDPNNIYQRLRITCKNSSSSSASSCKPDKKPCLFNITADPCEHTNLADQYPEVVKNMMDIIYEYDAVSVTPQSKPSDRRADPLCHDFKFVPWLDPEHYNECDYASGSEITYKKPISLS